MPAVPLVVGAIATYGGAAAIAAGGLTVLGAVAAGATLLGGVAMIAGTLKGGAEGAKWTGDGSMLAAIGSLGMNFTGASAAGTGAAETNATVNAADSGAISQGAQVTLDANAAAGTTTNMATAATNADQVAFNAAQDQAFNAANGITATPAATSPVLGANPNNPLNATLNPSPAVSSAPAPTINASGTGVTAGTDTAARTAATTIQPPSSSLTSNNNLMLLAGNAMSGYSQGQAAQEIQRQRVAAEQQAFARSQYNPLLTASNK